MLQKKILQNIWKFKKPFIIFELSNEILNQKPKQMKPKYDQITIFIPRKFFTKWESITEPSVVVDFEYFNEKAFEIKYVAFEPLTLLYLKSPSDVLQEVNNAIKETILDEVERANESFLDSLDRVVKRKEAIWD